MEKRTALAPEELAGLYRRHIQMVYQICLLMLKNVPDAEDAAQTVFRKRLERGPALQDPEREKAWLIVAARNECRDQLKHWWRTRRGDRPAAGGVAGHPPQPPVPGPKGPETAIGGGRLWTLVNSTIFLNRCPPPRTRRRPYSPASRRRRKR